MNGTPNPTTGRRRIKDMPAIVVRVEPNAQGTHILWHVEDAYFHNGTRANGFAQSPAEAMRDAAEFVEAMMQPRLGGLFKKLELRVVGESSDAAG